MKILLATHSSLQSQMFEAAFSLLGFEVVALAANGREAIDKYFESPGWIDLLFMDRQLQDMPGVEAAMQILAQDPSAKIIIMENRAGQSKELSFDIDDCRFKLKSFDMDKPEAL